MKAKHLIFPGSFNPPHEGHADIIRQACNLCEHLVILQAINPDKPLPETTEHDLYAFLIKHKLPIRKIMVIRRPGLLSDFVKTYNARREASELVGVVKGLRNANDFEYEKMQQYWNEDLGLVLPTIYLISNRSLVHYSSTAIRAVNKFNRT